MNPGRKRGPNGATFAQRVIYSDFANVAREDVAAVINRLRPSNFAKEVDKPGVLNSVFLLNLTYTMPQSSAAFSWAGRKVMSNETSLFHFQEGQKSFEDIGRPNGATRWLEVDLCNALGYQSDVSFVKAINRAKQACLSLNIPCEDHFHRQEDGSHLITRFGCYLVAMNGDTKKPEVAAAQAYFAAIAETFQNHLEHTNALERILIRDKITEEQRTLSGIAKAHGVQVYPFFLDQGYRGMYNMNLRGLTEYKGVPKSEHLIDCMDKTELAAHLFRITQTEAKIKNESIRGQAGLEKAAYTVGSTVRNTVIKISGKAPEDLPIAESIKNVKKRIKGTSKNFKALDAKKNKPKK